MSKITIYNRSDGKESSTKKSGNEPIFIPARCAKTKESFLIKLVENKKNWYVEETFKDGTTQNYTSTYSTDTIITKTKFNWKDFVCPICQRKSFVKCYTCKQITCWKGSGDEVCAYCGKHMSNISVGIDSIAIVSSEKKKK